MRYYLIILLFIFSSCNKDELGEIVIDDNNNLKPVKLYDTSIQNHEWNSGWFDNLTMSTKNGGTSPAFFHRGFTYFDYEGDGDMDVFVCVPAFENQWLDKPLEYGILINNQNVWSYKPLEEQLTKYASLITPADIDGDKDIDFVVFVADDPNNYSHFPNLPSGYENNSSPAGGIFAYIQDDGKFKLQTIVSYVEGGNQFYYHGGTLGDVDKDGDIDIIAGTIQTKIFLNNGNGNFDVSNIGRDGTFNTIFNCSQFLFDLNKDGYLDLIVGEAKDIRNDVRYYETFTKEEYASHTIIYYGKGSYPYYNEKPDILLEPQINIISDDLDKMFYENYDCMWDLSIVDFDNDGDYDIFTNVYKPIKNFNNMDEIRKGHLISYYENDNNKFVEKTAEVFEENEWFTSGCNSGFIKVIDIDKDGKKEILVEGGDCSKNGNYYNSWKLVNGKFRKTLL